MASKFLSPAYEVMLSAASPGINFLRGMAGYQDPIGTPAMQDRMLELEAQKGPSGSIGYEDYGLPVSSEGGRFTGGLPSLLLSNPIDFGLAGSVGRYGYSPEGRTDLKYDFTPDEETGSTGNAILDFINRGGIKNYISESKGLPFALPNLDYRNYDLSNLFNTTEPDLNNSALARRLITQPGLDKFTGINKGVYDPYGIKVEDGRFSYDMNKTSLADYQKPKNRFTGMDLESGYLDRAGSSDENIYEETETKKSNGIMDAIMSFVIPGYNFIKNLGSGQPYERYTPGGTIRDGIYSIGGVNVPVSMMNDFYNPRTGLNRFDRARQRYEQTGKVTDLFKSSRTGKEFFDKLRAKKEAERLKTVSQQYKEAADRGGGYQPTTTAQNTARTESRVSGGKTRAYGL